MNNWRPISEVDHEDGLQVQLWAPYARVSAWAWSEARQRWERDGVDGLFWEEDDEYGPTHFCALAEAPAALARAA